MVLKLFGKHLAALYSHYIMRIDREKIVRGNNSDGLTLEKLDTLALDTELDIGTTISKSALKRLVEKNGEKCDGFILKDDKNAYVGTIFVMYRGGDDIEYQIRNIDAYIFDVFIDEQSRGKGYAGIMTALLMDRLHKKGIDTAYLAVSKKNASAIRAYEKTGFVKSGEKTFARILKFNLPYHKL